MIGYRSNTDAAGAARDWGTMRMRLVLLVSAVVVSANISARCQERMGAGAGLESCGTWLRVRQQPNSTNKAIVESWVIGYLTAKNMDETQPEACTGRMRMEGMRGSTTGVARTR
jgi:hypothetical protein